MLLTLLLLGQVPTPSPPPLVPLDAPVAQVAPAPSQPVAPVVREAPHNVLLFAPLSLFGLFFSAELEHFFGPSVSVFGNVGASVFGLLAVEAGARYYAGENAPEGVFVSGGWSALWLTDNWLTLTGPAVLVGYSLWPSKNFVLSLAGGATMWLRGMSMSSANGFLGAAPQVTNVFVFPGVQLPPPGTVGVQPTLRASVGVSL